MGDNKWHDSDDFYESQFVPHEKSEFEESISETREAFCAAQEQKKAIEEHDDSDWFYPDDDDDELRELYAESDVYKHIESDEDNYEESMAELAAMEESYDEHYLWERPLQYCTPEEKGAIYECFVGKEYERNGYKVLYTGLVYNEHNDAGIDLIAYSESKQHIILLQCKYRSYKDDYSEKWIDTFKKAVAWFQSEFRPIWDTRAVVVSNWKDILASLGDKAEKSGIGLEYIYKCELDTLTLAFARQLKAELKEIYPQSMSILIRRSFPCEGYVWNSNRAWMVSPEYQVQLLLCSMQEKQEQIERLRSEKSKLKKQYEQELSDLRKQCYRESEENAEIKRSLNVSRAKNKELTSRLADTRCDTYKSECKKLETENEKLKWDLAAARKERDDYRSQLLICQKNCADLQLRNQQVLNANAQLTSEIQALKKKKGKWWQR